MPLYKRIPLSRQNKLYIPLSRIKYFNIPHPDETANPAIPLKRNAYPDIPLKKMAYPANLKTLRAPFYRGGRGGIFVDCILSEGSFLLVSNCSAQWGGLHRHSNAENGMQKGQLVP